MLEVIADYHDLCGECPIWNSDDSSVYWTDIIGRNFYRYHWPSKQHAMIRHGLRINAFRFHRDGGVVLTNSEGIWFWQPPQNPMLIIGEVENRKCQVNDCVTDVNGRLFAGSCFYESKRKYMLGQLIRVDTDGKASVVDEGFHMANGLAFSPDNRTLYVTDTIARSIYAYDYNADHGHISGKRVLVKVADTEGIPDGLCVDGEGFIWSAQWYGSRVVRFDPDGEPERIVDVPAKQTTSVSFGGSDLTDMFITSAAESGPLPVMPPNYDPQSGNLGGQLFHLNLGIQGKLEYKANITVIKT